jgi:glutathione S-transferase
VLWFLEEIGKPYDVVPIAREERRSREHVARHPLGRVPVVELDDGTYLFESAAICLSPCRQPVLRNEGQAIDETE